MVFDGLPQQLLVSDRLPQLILVSGRLPQQLRIAGPLSAPPGRALPLRAEREFFIDNLLVRIHFIIVMIRWTGLAPWEFEFPFPGSLTSTCLWLRI